MLVRYIGEADYWGFHNFSWEVACFVMNNVNKVNPVVMKVLYAPDFGIEPVGVY